MKAVLEPEPTFYRRCHVCGREITVPFGPEAAATTSFLLREHIREHDAIDLLRFVFSQHGVKVDDFFTGAPLASSPPTSPREGES